MNRRDFSLHLAGAGLGLALAPAAHAQGGPVEGQHYVKLSTPVPSQVPAGKKVEVIEFFSYACPHCHEFDPLLDGWIKRLPADVYFHRVAVAFNAGWLALQKTFFALDNMGKLDDSLHKKIFYTVHVQNKFIGTDAQAIAFAKANGVDEAKFTEMLKSFQVDNQVKRARTLGENYKIDGVPALGIQGRFYTSASLAGDYPKLLAVTDFLIQRSRNGA